MFPTRALLLLSALALSLSAQPKTPAAKPAPKPKPKAAAPVPAGPLQVGDPAPAFQVARWVKGGPLAKLEAGRVYVVEFWATWCGPCRETIPHLTEMAKARAGKAVFIGVNVWERGGDAAALDQKVDAFVKEMGARMDYAVCRDTAGQHMAKAWMQAANQRGIPAAFIVDKQGRIAHIGHPGEEAFAQALDKVIAGTHDLKAARAEAEKAAAEEKAAEAREAAKEAAWEAAQGPILKAQKAKDWVQVLTLCDAAEAKNPELKPELKRPRFAALAATDPAKAQALVDADLAKADMPTYMNTAVLLLTTPGTDKRWAEQALACIDKAVALEPRLAGRVATLRFRGLLRTDLPKAKTLFEEARGKDEGTQYATALLEDGCPDRELLASAAASIEEARKNPKASPLLARSLARGYFHLGQAAKAAEAQKGFVAFAKGAGAPPEVMAEFEKELATYQAAAK